MTPHMLDFVRAAVWHVNIPGPVLEIGSYIEANQDHLDLRTAFPRGTRYVGVDLLDGPGVDRHGDLIDPACVRALLAEVAPKVVLCLYVLEHVADIYAAASALAALWKENPESWLWVATHQNQPYHGTPKYEDYWRLTAVGLRRLFEGAGVSARVYVYPDRSNPSEVVAIRQPESMPWPDDAFDRTLRATSVRWEQAA